MSRSSRPRLIVPLAATVLSCAALGGCSSSAHPAAGPASSSAADSSAAISPAASAATSATSASSASSAVAASSASPGTPSAGGSPACPTAAQITSVVGSPYPAPVVQSGTGALLCTYSGTGVNLVISVATAAITPGVLQQLANTQAQAQKTTATAVSGIGEAAYIFTFTDANIPGGPSTTIVAVDGTHEYTIDGQLSATKIEAVARLVI